VIRRPQGGGTQPIPHINKVMGSLRWEGECVICTRTPNKKGYIKIKTSDVTKYAHRVMWEHHNGPVPDDMCVLHECDNPPCVRIEHLHLGTTADNNREMVARGRHWAQKLRETA
jgi:hypothetical protein